MDFNIQKVCRVCLEDGANTSIFSTDFAMMPPSTMLMICAKIRISKRDGLPSVICDKCLYRLGAAYHFKQECENSDMRLRQYLGISETGYRLMNAETNTEMPAVVTPLDDKLKTYLKMQNISNSPEKVVQEHIKISKKNKKNSRYKRKTPDEQKKRGPKPLPKSPQTCYECKKTFKCAAQLQLHIRTHTGEKPFACKYCSKIFAQKYNLQVHERIHTGEKPFQCEICSKTFSALGNFQAHQKIHTGIRDQLCPICQKSFYTAGDLTKHMAIHTGIKNHHCDICGKAFSRLRDIKSHKYKLHAISVSKLDKEQVDTVKSIIDENLKCLDCDKEFANSSNLALHMRMHSTNSFYNLPLAGQMIHQHTPSSVSTHAHDNLHPHTHHFSLNGAMQTNSSIGMAMAHIQSPLPHTTHSAHYSVQRMHPY